MYTKKDCLRSNLRACTQLRLISSSLCPLSVNLNLSRDASRSSWSNFVRIFEIRDSFYESGQYWVGVASCSVEILVCLSWFGAYFDIQYVWIWIFCLCTLRYPGMWIFGVRSYVLMPENCGSCLQFGRSLLHDAQVPSPMPCTHHVWNGHEFWFCSCMVSCASHMSGDGIAPIEAPIIWW